MTYVEKLIAARDAAADRLILALGQSTPTYSDQGRSVNTSDEIRALTEQLASLDARIAAADPYVVTTRLYP